MKHFKLSPRFKKGFWVYTAYMIEVERKFKINKDQKSKILSLLENKHGQVQSVFQSDIVFLQEIKSFRQFKRGMPVVRIRTVGEETKMTCKRVINTSGDAVEHELVISSANIMQDILKECNFNQVSLVNKRRIEYKEDEISIALDEVDGLGSYLEIEILTSEDKISDSERQIFDQASKFGLKREDIETKKYDELLEAASKL